MCLTKYVIHKTVDACFSTYHSRRICLGISDFFLAYLPVGSVQTLVVVWHMYDLKSQLVDGSSRGPANDQLVRQMAPAFGVPLLSQEGRTCCLLPGAAAPYPALDQVPEH